MLARLAVKAAEDKNADAAESGEAAAEALRTRLEADRRAVADMQAKVREERERFQREQEEAQQRAQEADEQRRLEVQQAAVERRREAMWKFVGNLLNAIIAGVVVVMIVRYIGWN